MLVAALTVICGNISAQDGERTVLWEASSGDPLVTIYADDNISLKWEEGGGDMAPKYASGSVYFYNGNRLTVAGVSADVTITKIVFTFSSDRISLVTCDNKGKNENADGITSNAADGTTTWQGETGSVCFRASKQTGPRYISSIAVTYTGGSEAPVEKAPVLAITDNTIGTTYDMDANGVFVVYAKNDGNAAADNARLTVFVDDKENAVWQIGTLAIGEEKWQNMKFSVDGIEAGEHQVYLTLTADNAEAVTTEATTVTFTRKEATASFELTAQPIEIQLPAETATAVVNVRNSSLVDATDVKVNLWNNGVIATQTIASLPAGASQTVTFEFANPFQTAGDYSMQALTADNMYGCYIDVTVLAAPEEEIADVTIDEIADIEATTDEEVTISATVRNLSSDSAIKDVIVMLFKDTDEVGKSALIEEIAAGEESTVEFHLGMLAAGTYLYTLQILSEDGNADNNMQSLTVTVTDSATTAIRSVGSHCGSSTQVVTISGKRTHNVRKGNVYIINGRKVVVR